MVGRWYTIDANYDREMLHNWGNFKSSKYIFRIVIAHFFEPNICSSVSKEVLIFLERTAEGWYTIDANHDREMIHNWGNFKSSKYIFRIVIAHFFEPNICSSVSKEVLIFLERTAEGWYTIDANHDREMIHNWCNFKSRKYIFRIVIAHFFQTQISSSVSNAV